ncbi:uncharacterized protein LOC132707966 isoform X2 [Cylas formicarius]|uniref:uncharacterized protein LOC132707966 isoform X2 n=1 Tax=Cylas formicarius TaxID=197179 RepID=UPI002958A9FE|nr:uncharacterized protein LOC132707966 isoform X2 [Cylas formicarius]
MSMDHPRFCAIIRTNGPELELDRRTINAEFSRFGKVTKIYIDPGKTVAKVYLDNLEQLRKACQQLHKKSDWCIEFSKDQFFDNRTQQRLDHHNNRFYCDNRVTSQAVSDTTSGPINMDSEEECEILENYVNGHGRPVTVLRADNGQLFVDLNDIRASGFAIFRKEDYKTTILTKMDDLREFESFLLNQAVAYQLNTRRNFATDEIFNTIEKVKERLWGSQRNEQNIVTSMNGDAPVVNVTRSYSGLSSNNAQNKPRQSDQYAAPSCSHVKQTKIESQNINRQSFITNGARSNEFNQDSRNTKPINSIHITNSRPKPLRKPNVDKTLENLHLKPVGSKKAPSEDEDWFDDCNTGTIPKLEEQAVAINTSAKPCDIPIEFKQTDSANPCVESGAAVSSINKVSLPVSSNPSKVRISYVMERENKSRVYFVQRFENIDLVDDLLLQLNTLSENQNIANPIENGVYLFQFEELWYRGKLIRINKDQSYLVDLIDYGNIENLKNPVKELPEKFKSTPAQSIRITFTNESPLATYKVDDEIEIVARKQYDDGTYLVQIFAGCSEVPSSSQSKHEVQPVITKPLTPKSHPVTDNSYFVIPPLLGPLKNNEKVMILGITDGKLLLRTKDCAAHCKELYKLISDMEKQSITNVKEGQLVLCSRDKTEGLHRGVVKKIENSAAYIDYLDYDGTETLSLKSLRNVNAELAAAPRALVESPPYSALKSTNIAIEDFINKLIITKKKLDVIMENGDFDLRIDSNTLLSQEIENLRVKDQPLSDVVSEDVVRYEDMPYAKLKKGTGWYFCYSCKDTETITLISSEPEYEKYLNDLIITICDTAPYAPEIYHMCLAKFHDQWYRATVIDVDEEHETFQVLFVDFGNVCDLEMKDLRRLPRKYATIPILGVSSYFIGLPTNNTKLNSRLQELIPDATFLDVNVKTDLDPDKLQYGIEIPEVYETLKSEGFI